MSKEPPSKRARSSVASARAAVQSALSADASRMSEAVRVVQECKAELRDSLAALVEFHSQITQTEALQQQVREWEEITRTRVNTLAASENRLLELEIKASGTISPLFPSGSAPVSLTSTLAPVSLRRLVWFAQQVSYSTAGPPLTPSGAISLMPLASTMRLSTLFNPVPKLADPLQDQLIRPPPMKQEVAAPSQPQQGAPTHKGLPENLDLDLEDSADASSSDESSAESSSSSSVAEKDNGW
jgi:hypothetical protein